MRSTLLRLLGKGAWLKSSYLPGRSGFLLYSTRPLPELRAHLMPWGACRLLAIHEPSGRLFLEPSQAMLSSALCSDEPEHWWSRAHQEATAAFFSPLRADRVRRLPRGVREPTGGEASTTSGQLWTRGFPELRVLALRLESLSVTPRPDKHWSGIARAFDRLWNGTRLYALPSSSLATAVYAHLLRCRSKAMEGCSGKY